MEVRWHISPSLPHPIRRALYPERGVVLGESRFMRCELDSHLHRGRTLRLRRFRLVRVEGAGQRLGSHKVSQIRCQELSHISACACSRCCTSIHLSTLICIMRHLRADTTYRSRGPVFYLGVDRRLRQRVHRSIPHIASLPTRERDQDHQSTPSCARPLACARQLHTAASDR